MANGMKPKQALVMWCLLGKHGQALQSEIVPKVEKKDREALVAAGFISSEKPQRAFVLKVEDKGWHWASEHLRDELPRGYQVLQHWLTRLHNYLETNDETLAAFIGSAPVPEEDVGQQKRSRSTQKKRSVKTKKSKSRSKNKKTATRRRREPEPSIAAKLKQASRPTPEQLRVRIEEAYLAVTNGRKSEIVLLSKLRAQLGDLDRATVDAGLLRILQGDSKARLSQISDPKALTQDDRDAAFSPGGEALHFLWIGS